MNTRNSRKEKNNPRFVHPKLVDFYRRKYLLFKFQRLACKLKQVKYQQSEVLVNNLKYAAGFTGCWKDCMVIWKNVKALYPL